MGTTIKGSFHFKDKIYIRIIISMILKSGIALPISYDCNMTVYVNTCDVSVNTCDVSVNTCDDNNTCSYQKEREREKEGEREDEGAITT